MVLCDVILLYDDVVKSVKDEESFSDAVIRLARERNMSGPKVYHAAGIDARHYSKIISDRNYQPKKETVFAFILVFKLPLKEAEELLNKAGYSFCSASKYDLLIKSFIEKVYMIGILSIAQWMRFLFHCYHKNGDFAF